MTGRSIYVQAVGLRGVIRSLRHAQKQLVRHLEGFTSSRPSWRPSPMCRRLRSAPPWAPCTTALTDAARTVFRVGSIFLTLQVRVHRSGAGAVSLRWRSRFWREEASAALHTDAALTEQDLL